MQFRQGFLAGTSTLSQSPSDLVEGDFDYVLLSSSWDRRSISVACADKLRASHGALLLFDTRDDQGLRDRHDAELTTFLNRIVPHASVIQGDSTDTSAIWEQLTRHFSRAAREVGRPMRVFIDLSTCPRYLSIGLAAQSLLSGLAHQVSCFYAEGHYPEELREEDQHEMFTEGGWSSIEIPGMHGQWDPEKRRSYVASVGFEGSKTLRLIAREEPDCVSILFPDPGVKQDYVARTQRRNADLIRRFKVPQERIIRAPAGDAIAAWHALAGADFEDPDEQNIYYVCCGTKAHSLALSLRAMVFKYPAVLYIVPDRHRVVDIEPLGSYWRYDLHDVTSMTPKDEIEKESHGTSRITT